MKIRTDFVTNSSSSNFVAVIVIKDNNGKEYKYEEDPSEFNPDEGGECRIGSPASVLKDSAVSHGKYGYTSFHFDADGKKPDQFLAFDSVAELVKELVDSVEDPYCDIDEYCSSWGVDKNDDDDFGLNNIKDYIENIENRKKAFVSEVADGIKSVNDITEIETKREYSGYGEGSEAIEWFDPELAELASRVNSGDNNAIKEMRDHLAEPDKKRYHFERFAIRFKELKYHYYDTEDLSQLSDEEVKEIAESIINCVYRESEGTEHRILNLKDGTFKAYAEYTL